VLAAADFVDNRHWHQVILGMIADYPIGGVRLTHLGFLDCKGCMLLSIFHYRYRIVVGQSLEWSAAFSLQCLLHTRGGYRLSATSSNRTSTSSHVSVCSSASRPRMYFQSHVRIPRLFTISYCFQVARASSGFPKYCKSTLIP
jgi:hypothetical protein